MNHILKISIYALTIALLSSCCSNLYYVNDPVVFANVTKKADFNLAGGFNVGTLTSGSHLQGSAAISNRLYLSSSFSNYSGNCSESSSANGNNNSIKYSGHSFLCGLGYYKTLGKNYYFEGLIGGKYGNNSNKKANEDFEYRHLKYVIQPGLTYTRDHFQAGIALRFGMIDYLPFKTGSENRIPEIATQGAKPYVDPAFYICGGGQYVKVGGQISSTFADNSTIAYTPLGSYLVMLHQTHYLCPCLLKLQSLLKKQINNKRIYFLPVRALYTLSHVLSLSKHLLSA